MQLICYMKLYDTPAPPQSLFFINELIKILEFQQLNLFGLIRIFKPNFSLSGVKVGKAPRLIDQLQSYLSLAILFAACMVLALILMVILRRLKDYIRLKLAQLKEKMIWNGTIRSIYIGYLKALVEVGA